MTWHLPAFCAAVLMLGYGCSGAFKDSPEACLGPKLAPLEALYFAESHERCHGFTWDECPYRAELQKKYDAKRAEAIEACK